MSQSQCFIQTSKQRHTYSRGLYEIKIDDSEVAEYKLWPLLPKKTGTKLIKITRLSKQQLKLWIYERKEYSLICNLVDFLHKWLEKPNDPDELQRIDFLYLADASLNYSNTYFLSKVDSKQIFSFEGEADVVGDLVEIVYYLIIMDDGRQMVPIDNLRLEGRKDWEGKSVFLFLVLIEENIEEGDLEIAEEITDHLADSLEVVVDQQDRDITVNNRLGCYLSVFLYILRTHASQIL